MLTEKECEYYIAATEELGYESIAWEYAEVIVLRKIVGNCWKGQDVVARKGGVVFET